MRRLARAWNRISLEPGDLVGVTVTVGIFGAALAGPFPVAGEITHWAVLVVLYGALLAGVLLLVAVLRD